MDRLEQTCGQEIAGSAAVPEQVAQLFRHVAVNLRAHAAWVGTASAASRREHAGMLAVAEGYETIALHAVRTAEIMRTMHEVPPAEHDPENWDRDNFILWMKQKIELQRALGAMLVEHAEQSEQVLAQMAAAPR